MPQPRTASVDPDSSAPRWAAPSTPRASPETTTDPRGGEAPRQLEGHGRARTGVHARAPTIGDATRPATSSGEPPRTNRPAGGSWIRAQAAAGTGSAASDPLQTGFGRPLEERPLVEAPRELREPRERGAVEQVLSRLGGEHCRREPAHPTTPAGGRYDSASATWSARTEASASAAIVAATRATLAPARARRAAASRRRASGARRPGRPGPAALGAKRAARRDPWANCVRASSGGARQLARRAAVAPSTRGRSDREAPARASRDSAGSARRACATSGRVAPASARTQVHRADELERAGKTARAATRATQTTPSSSGWRSASSTGR